MTRASIFLFLWIINSVAVGDADTVLVTLPTFLLCVFNVWRIRSPFLTTADMFWFVYFMFFVIGPIQTFSDNYFVFGSTVFGVYFSDPEIYAAAAIAFIFAAAATLSGVIWAKRSSDQVREGGRYVLSINITWILVGILVVSFAALVVLSGGFGNLLASRFEKDAESQSVLRVFALCSQMVVTFLILIDFNTSRESRRKIGYLGIASCGLALLLLLIAQNPYNTPRYYLVQAWLPVILIFLRGKLRAVPFYFACLFGILILLPIFSLTSRFGANFSEAIKNVNLSEDFFHWPYIDVFDMLIYEIRYVGDVGFSYGSRTLGALFFFIPRSIWTGKPNLIALEMGEELVAMKVAGTENLSLFFGGEFYADFGLAGVALFGILFCWLYLRIFHNRKVSINGLLLRDFIMISAVPILLRGPIGANAPLVFIELITLAIYTPLLCVRQRSRSKITAQSAVMS